jgi:hypothetical protein
MLLSFPFPSFVEQKVGMEKRIWGMMGSGKLLSGIGHWSFKPFLNKPYWHEVELL